MKTIKLYFRNIHWYIVKREIDTDRISLFTMHRTRKCECKCSPFLSPRIAIYRVYNRATAKNHQLPASFVHTLNTCMQLRPHVHISALLYVYVCLYLYLFRADICTRIPAIIFQTHHRFVSREAQPLFATSGSKH